MKIHAITIVVFVMLSGLVSAEDKARYDYQGQIISPAPKEEVWHSSAGYFKIVEANPGKILRGLFPRHQGVHYLNNAPTRYIYVGAENLPEDRFFSAVVPYDTESRLKFLRDLGEDLGLKFELKKKTFPCRLVSDIAKPYPETWTPDADYDRSSGLLSKLPVLCVLHRCAGKATDEIQIILNTKDKALTQYRLSTLKQEMNPDEILTALGMPVDKTPREFSCLVIHRLNVEPTAEQGDGDQPATSLDSKAEGKEKPKPESEGRSQ